MIKKELNDVINKNIKNEYNIYSAAQEIASEALAKHYKEKKNFPINIRAILEENSIALHEMNLNTDIGLRIRKINGYLQKTSDDKWEIYVHNGDSEFSKRYIMAHEFSYYLLYENLGRKELWTPTHHCVDPLFAEHGEDLICDVIASFILFPPELVLDSLSKYKNIMEKKSQYPMDAFEWLRILGQHAQISSYFTIISYQHLKFYMYYNQNEWDDYREFFR